MVVLSELFVRSTQSREVDMDYEVRDCVEYWHHAGGMNPEKTCEVVGSTDPAELELPDGVFAFSFFQVLVATVEYQNEEFELESCRTNETVPCFPDARILTLDEARRNAGRYRDAISHMVTNGVDRCIVTRDSYIELCPNEFEILAAA